MAYRKITHGFVTQNFNDDGTPINCPACQVEHHDVCGLDSPESKDCPCCTDTRQQMAEQQRRDEKNGLYPDRTDDCN